MNQNALLIAVAGGLAVWWLWRRQTQASVTGPPEPMLNVQTGTWSYPAGSMPGPSETTYRDPSGAVLMRPDAPELIDWT